MIDHFVSQYIVLDEVDSTHTHTHTHTQKYKKGNQTKD